MVSSGRRNGWIGGFGLGQTFLEFREAMEYLSIFEVLLMEFGGFLGVGWAHKKGEVVGPAGGETGVPRCLAEDRKLLSAASFLRKFLYII